MPNGGPPDGLRDLLSPELSLPILPEFQVSRAQVCESEEESKWVVCLSNASLRAVEIRQLHVSVERESSKHVKVGQFKTQWCHLIYLNCSCYF